MAELLVTCVCLHECPLLMLCLLSCISRRNHNQFDGRFQVSSSRGVDFNIRNACLPEESVVVVVVVVVVLKLLEKTSWPVMCHFESAVKKW